MMLGAMRRGVVTLSPRVGSSMRRSIVPIVSRSMVTISEKERGDEEMYIRRTEKERNEKLKLKMEELLARDFKDEKKHALLEALEHDKKPKEEDLGMIQYYGLDEWRWGLPVGLLVLVPLFSHQVIVFDARMYHIAVFAMTWHLYDKVVMPTWVEKSEYVYTFMNSFWKNMDDNISSEINQSIKTNEDFLDVKESFQNIFALTDDIAKTQAEALNFETKNEFHAAIIRKLDALVALNESTTATIRADMVSTVKQEAMKTLKDDRKVKDAILNQAIQSLAAGTSGKRGKDIVGDIFAQSVAKYRTSASSKDHPINKIAAQLEKDIEDIVKAPEVIAKAGNVYETHPVLA